MGWRKILAIVLALAAFAAGGLFFARATLPFRANRVLYLKNAHRYAAALQEYERLLSAHPAEARPLPRDFRARLIEDAAAYYNRPYVRLSERAAFLDFLDTVARRSELAPLARRKRLDYFARLDSRSSATLAAARAILNHEGFDPDALWWAAFNQFDPIHPLDTPPELLGFRVPFAAAPTPALTQPLDEPALRFVYLNAVLDLSDRNWAEAVPNLALYRKGHPETPGLDFALGLAQLRSGHPEAALPSLRQYRRQNSNDFGALRFLAEAYLALSDYPWAAHALDEIRAQAPTQEPPVFQDCFALTGGRSFFSLCAGLRRGGPWERDVALWNWLADLARTPQEQGAVDAAADLLLADNARPADQAALLQYCLRRDRFDAARLLLATASAADTTATLRRRSIERILQWYPARTGPAESPNRQLLSRDSTVHFHLALPQGATFAIAIAQGFPAAGAWPIVHFSLGVFGDRTYYLGNSRARARPLVLALRHPSERLQTVRGSLSLIDGDEPPGAVRSLMLVEVRAF